MSVIIFSDWNNYTEDGVPKVLDWNNLELYDYFIPMHAIVQGLNERLDLATKVFNSPFPPININNYTLSAKLFHDIETKIFIIFDSAPMFIKVDYNGGDYNNVITSPSYLTRDNITLASPPYINLNYNSLPNFVNFYGDTYHWLLQQKEIINNIIWIMLPTFCANGGSSQFPFHPIYGKREGSDITQSGAITAFNNASIVWENIFQAHRSIGHYAYDFGTIFRLNRTYFKMTLEIASLSSIKSIKSAYANYIRIPATSYIYDNNDTNISVDKYGYYIEETLPSATNAELDSSLYIDGQSSNFVIGYAVGYWLIREPSIIFKFNVTGGFKFVPNIII